MTQFLMRMWWALLLGAIVSGLAAFIVVNAQPDEYQARARLLVGELSGDFDAIRASEALATTYAELATTGMILDRTLTLVEMDTSASDVREHMDAVTVGSSRILLVTVRGQDPERAADLAVAWARTLQATATESGHTMTVLDSGDSAEKVSSFDALLVVVAAAGGAALVASMLLLTRSTEVHDGRGPKTQSG